MSEFDEVVEKIVLHHTGIDDGSGNWAGQVRDIYEFETASGYRDIAYHFLVDPTGAIYEGRWARDYPAAIEPDGEDAGGRSVRGGHARGHNPRTIGVALLGDYTSGQPSEAALTALVEVLAWKCARWHLDPQGESAYVLAAGDNQTLPTIVPHGQIRATECPGPHFDRLVPDLRARTAAALATARGGGTHGHRPVMSDEGSTTRVLLRPRWIAGHITVVVVAAIFVALGFWQLARNHEKQDGERAARAEYAAPAPALGDPDSPPPSGTRVEVTGTYDAAGEVLLRNRVRGGNGGYDVLTPLHLADGTAVVVDRGSVARNPAETGRASLTPPAGTVTVRGPISEPRALQVDDTVDERGGRTTLPRVDLDRIGQDVSSPLRNVYVTAQWQDPVPVNDGPALPDPPEADEVNHLSYAFQWFAFALIPLVGWPIVLYRVTRRDQTKAAGNTAPATAP